ncbi:hypothetical protein BD626DRAFT_533633 [Schizophyllum amplum]|uniref:C2H2-type domain-containing protein n=1 Tax=Schizophyllum amplum TaxID=97359 RepID=A0A550CZW8_9AGAR|nr:hypothetical protein BD626DRAFT_533633 [Auriculariopsis ampla]
MGPIFGTSKESIPYLHNGEVTTLYVDHVDIVKAQVLVSRIRKPDSVPARPVLFRGKQLLEVINNFYPTSAAEITALRLQLLTDRVKLALKRGQLYTAEARLFQLVFQALPPSVFDQLSKNKYSATDMFAPYMNVADHGAWGVEDMRHVIQNPTYNIVDLQDQIPKDAGTTFYPCRSAAAETATGLPQIRAASPTSSVSSADTFTNIPMTTPRSAFSEIPPIPSIPKGKKRAAPDAFDADDNERLRKRARDFECETAQDGSELPGGHRRTYVEFLPDTMPAEEGTYKWTTTGELHPRPVRYRMKKPHTKEPEVHKGDDSNFPESYDFDSATFSTVIDVAMWGSTKGKKRGAPDDEEEEDKQERLRKRARGAEEWLHEDEEGEGGPSAASSSGSARVRPATPANRRNAKPAHRVRFSSSPTTIPSPDAIPGLDPTPATAAVPAEPLLGSDLDLPPAIQRRIRAPGMRGHVNLGTDNSPHYGACSICNEKTYGAADISRHILKHFRWASDGCKPGGSNGGLFHCAQCGRGFSGVERLRSHFKKFGHTGDVKPVCRKEMLVQTPGWGWMHVNFEIHADD